MKVPHILAPATNRRWPRFSLRTLFIVVTLLCLWLGWKYGAIHRTIQERHHVIAWLNEHGGMIYNGGVPTPFVNFAPAGVTAPMHLSRWRRWLGDMAITDIELPPRATAAEIARVKDAF